MASPRNVFVTSQVASWIRANPQFKQGSWVGDHYIEAMSKSGAYIMRTISRRGTENWFVTQNLKDANFKSISHIVDRFTTGKKKILNI